jgi:hypothetical protein
MLFRRSSWDDRAGGENKSSGRGTRRRTKGKATDGPQEVSPQSGGGAGSERRRIKVIGAGEREGGRWDIERESGPEEARQSSARNAQATATEKGSGLADRA